MLAKTPRTDEEVEIAKKFPATNHGLWVSAEFARHLERELAEARDAEMMKAQQCTAERLRANAAEEVAGRETLNANYWKANAQSLAPEARYRVMEDALRNFPEGYDEEGVYTAWKQQLDHDLRVVSKEE